MDNWGKRKNGQAYKKKPKTSSDQTNELATSLKNRKEKQLKNKSIKTKKVSVKNFGNLKEGIDFKITKRGYIDYIHGFGHILEQIGGKKLTDKQIQNMITNMTDKKLNTEYTIEQLNNEYQTDSTSIMGTLLTKNIDYGIFNYNEGEYITFKEGGTKHPQIYDITNISVVKDSQFLEDVFAVLDPEISIDVSIDNMDYNILLRNATNGNFLFKNNKSIDNQTLDKYGNLYKISEKALSQHLKK